MTSPTRVLLLNTERDVSREEIARTDRVVGEAYFSELNLQYGNHVIAEGKCKLAASWLVPEDKIPSVIALLQTKQSPVGYETMMNLRLVGITSEKPAKFV
jgi:hypothetical protein